MIAMSSPGAAGPLARPVPLPEAPLLDILLFEQPWILSLPLGVVAIVALFLMNARARLGRGLIIAGSLALLAAAVWVCAALVTTPREHIRRSTRILVDAVASADMPATDAILAPDVRIRYRGFEAPSRPALLLAIERAMGPRGQYHLSSWRIAEIQATIDGPGLGRSQVLVRATHAQTAVPASAWVVLKWEREADGRWLCFAVEPIDVR